MEQTVLFAVEPAEIPQLCVKLGDVSKHIVRKLNI